jgi:hypothetical protein
VDCARGTCTIRFFNAPPQRGFAPILPEGIHGGTMVSLEARNDPVTTMRCKN